MNNHQQVQLAALHDRIRFINRHVSTLGALRAAPAYLALEHAARVVSTLAAEQRHARAEYVRLTRLKCERRETLWQQHMKPIAAIARACLTLSPRLAELTPDREMTDGACANAAAAMANAASHHEDRFMRQQLPDTFLLQLRTAEKALREAMAAQRASRLLVTAVTRQMAEKLSASHTAARILDALVAARIWNNEELQAAWRAAKRVTAPVSPRARVERAA